MCLNITYSVERSQSIMKLFILKSVKTSLHLLYCTIKRPGLLYFDSRVHILAQ